MKTKKVNHRACRLLFTVICMLFMLLPMTVLAGESDTAYSYPLPITVKVSGDTVPSDASFEVKIQAVTEGAPMPAKDTLTFQGEGTLKFDAIAYTTPADYYYKVTQTVGNYPDMTYDTTEYEVIVHVTNGEGGKLTGTIVSRIGTTEKPDSVTFTNTYDVPEPESESESESETEPKKNETEPPKPDGSVKTGDNTPIMLLITVLVISAAVILVLGMKRRQARN